MPLPVRGPTPETEDYAALQPAATPGSTYVRPPAETPAGNDLLRLSQGLGELSPQLLRFGEAYKAQEDKRALLKVQADEPLKSDKQALADYQARGGTPSDFDPAGIAQSKLMGARRATQLQQDITTDLNTRDIDWRTFDTSEYLTKKQAEYADVFKNDPYARIGFNDVMKSFPEKLAEMRTKGGIQQQNTIRSDNAYEAISLTGDKAAEADGATPESVNKAIRATIAQVAGPNGSQAVPFAEADKYVIQKAGQWISQGKNLDIAIGLLIGERQDEKGNRIPPLANSAANAQQVNSLILQAGKLKQKEALRTALQGITDSDTKMFASGSQGKLAVVGDITYRDPEDPTQVKTVKGTDRQTNVIRKYSQELSPQIAQANRETPEQTFNRELNVYANGGVDNPDWKKTLEAAPLGASLNELTDPKKRDQLLSAANLYDNLKEKNPLYLQQLVDKKTQDFFDTYRVAKGMPSPSGNGQTATMEEAADMSRRAISAGKDADDALKGHFKKIEEATINADPSTFFSRWFGGERSMVNGGYVQQQVSEKAKLFVRMGLSPDQAIEKAADAVKNGSTTVNGWVIPKLNVQLPSSFPQAAAGYLKTFAEQNGSINNGLPASQMGLAYDGAGTFTVVGPNGMALRTSSGLARFTLKDLAGLGANQDAQLREQLLTEGAQKQQRKVQAGDNLKNPLTRELIDRYNTMGAGMGAPVFSFPGLGDKEPELPPKPPVVPGKTSFWSLINPISTAQAATPSVPTVPREGPAKMSPDIPEDGGPVGDVSDLSTYRRKGQLMPKVEGLIWHHTAGRGTPEDIQNVLNVERLGVQFIMDRDGKVYRALPDGSRGAHIRDSQINGLNNGNAIGVEVIAKDDKDVTPAQVASGKKFSQWAMKKYGFGPDMVFGHGEVNPGHRLPSEGMSIVNAVRAENGLSPGTPKPATPVAATPVAATPIPVNKRTLATYGGRD